MLTQRQHELLTFIDNHITQKGFSPSFDEMKDGLRLKSMAALDRLIAALEERGFLARHQYRVRTRPHEGPKRAIMMILNLIGWLVYALPVAVLVGNKRTA